MTQWDEDRKIIEARAEQVTLAELGMRYAAALERIAELEAGVTVYVHMASTGEGCPSGTWRGDEQPPLTVHVLGDPDAVKAVRAWRDERVAAETRVSDLERGLQSIVDRHPDAPPGEHPAVDIARRLLSQDKPNG